MSEKVLLFLEKRAKIRELNDDYFTITLKKEQLRKQLPVRLTSESVDLKWLRGEIENFYYCNPEMEGANMALKHLLSIAEKEAKKK